MKGVIEKNQLKTVFYRQDNAGCYHCGATIVGATFAGCCSGVSVKRMDFSDPQGGKATCDRKAASNKSHMTVYLNQGSNIDNAKEMINAIQSLGGVPGVDVMLCSSSQIPKPTLNVKIEGVSLISNIEYNDGNLRVWKVYGIEPGKCVQLTKLGIPPVVPIPDLVKYDGDTVKPTPNAHFNKIKSRLPSRSDDSQECSILKRTLGLIPHLFLFFPVPRKGARKSIRDFPPYSTIWTLESMNVLWSMQHFLTDQYSATQIDYKSSPVVYHRYSILESV